MDLPKPGSFRCWILAIRPKTLFAAVAPVMLGSALAAAGGSFSFPAGAAALFGALFLQVGTNLANDYWDGIKGTDTPERLGPPRATASRLLPPHAVLAGSLAAFLAASLVGLALFLLVGWPIIVIGLVSILCGLAYTAGPFPLAYLGLGDLFTFLFFGLVATAGTFFVHTAEFSSVAVFAGAMPGLYSVVLIALNNLRDLEGDRVAGKWTLPARFGHVFARIEIGACMILAALVPAGLAAFWGIPSPFEAAACGTVGLLAALNLIKALQRIAHPREINALFPRVGFASLGMAALLSCCLLWRGL